MPWRPKLTWARASSPAPSMVDHDAFAELAVEHALPRPQAVRRRLRHHRRVVARLAAAGADDRVQPRAALPGLLVFAREAGAERLVARRDPAQRRLGQLVEEAALDVVARLAVQHARLREAEVEALSGARDGHVHQAPFLLEAVEVARRVLVREEALLEAADEDAVELEALGRVDRHQLDRVLPRLRLVVARLERRVGEERGERRHDLAGLGVGHDARRRDDLAARDDLRARGGELRAAAPAPREGRDAAARRDSSTGSATASLPKPSCVTNASAALTSSSRFSSRSLPSRSVL